MLNSAEGMPRSLAAATTLAGDDRARGVRRHRRGRCARRVGHCTAHVDRLRPVHGVRGRGDAHDLRLSGGHHQADIEANGYQLCTGYDYADLREFLTTLPEVEAAGRWTLAISRVAPLDHPDRNWRQLVPAAIDPEAVAVVGTPIVVDGRLADPEVATEATINEEEASRMGVDVGDQLVVTPYRTRRVRSRWGRRGVGRGPPTTVTVVGITRRPNDLVGRLGGTSIYEDTSAVSVGPAWWSEIEGDAAVYGIGVCVLTTSPATRDTVVRAVRDRWPDRPWQVDDGELFGQDSQQTVRDAIRLQTVGLYLVAAVVAIAGFLFAGQALSRQSRAEWSDAVVLDAIGMTRRNMVAGASIRGSGVRMRRRDRCDDRGAHPVTSRADRDRSFGGTAPRCLRGLDGARHRFPLVVLSVIVFAVAPVATIRIRALNGSAARSLAPNESAPSRLLVLPDWPSPTLDGRGASRSARRSSGSRCGRRRYRRVVAGQQLRPAAGRAGEVRLDLGRTGGQRREPLAAGRHEGSTRIDPRDRGRRAHDHPGDPGRPDLHRLRG